MPGFASSAKSSKRRKQLNASKTTNLIWAGIIILVVVALDQVTKLWAVSALSGIESIEVMGRFFMLTLVYNQGGAMGTNLGSSTYYLVTSSLILLFVLYYIYRHSHQRGLSFTLAFIAGGAIGNLIDRFRIGEVVDFLDMDFFDINIFGYQIERWYAFNIADAAITCAIVWLLQMMIFSKSLEDGAEPAPATDMPVESTEPG